MESVDDDLFDGNALLLGEDFLVPELFNKQRIGIVDPLP